MASYSLTQAAALFSAGGDLVVRVQIALVARAAARFEDAVGAEAAYVRRVAANPAGEANAAVVAVLSAVSVADTGTESTPLVPTDVELTAGVVSAWPFLIG